MRDELVFVYPGSGERGKGKIKAEERPTDKIQSQANTSIAIHQRNEIWFEIFGSQKITYIKQIGMHNCRKSKEALLYFNVENRHKYILLWKKYKTAIPNYKTNGKMNGNSDSFVLMTLQGIC